MNKNITLEDVKEFIREYGYKYAQDIREELDKTRKISDEAIKKELEKNGHIYKRMADEQYKIIPFIIVLTIKNEPWFVGKDVAEKLGYKNTKNALKKHVDIEDKQIIQKGQIATLEIPNRGLTIINESGLYSLILSNKLPEANKFKRWVTNEVLPSIRKNGAYMTDLKQDKGNCIPESLSYFLQSFLIYYDTSQLIEV